ncbi:polysaccharide pyruvyl transferase family protein [Acetobacterium wieringae]|uniref:polysaccharide pyruvyl transferase family protein n=1 Tax=Acetobacterium wieringae TaxID=52694 RepID=UPI002033B672|nr:polysaccharide pyruvyl transferase family protein [Acetobacterium wieringae]URN84115.1 polysaccharide pyruvyl transferase family protein [Acetobacterium wieringae]
MNIAILSMQKVINYGSVLQAYSLKRMIEEITNEKVYFIDIDNSDKLLVSGTVSTVEDYSKNGYSLKNAPWLVPRKLINKIKKNNYTKKIKEFQCKELDLQEKYNRQTYDLVFVGSDEVFVASKYICMQLYGKINNAKAIVSYAAAAGMAQFNNISNDDIPVVRNSLKNFRFMSVRDDHTKEYISNIYDGDIEKHVDPVLVGNLRKRVHKRIEQGPYMIVYAYAERISNFEEIKAIRKFAKKNGLKIICIGGQQLWADEFVALSPFDMLDYFRYTEYVITDTFHGIVFSMINHSKFAVLQRKSNEFKIQGVLKAFNLTQRFVSNLDDLEIILNADIDYETVDFRLDEERKRSKEYLENCILACSKGGEL